jgi:hypothetical protein
MNERIRELIEQATSHMPGRPPYDSLTFDVFDKEKFAELIVQDCVGIADHSNVNGKSIIGERIKQHFGVEE